MSDSFRYMRASDWAGAIGETWAEEWVRTDRTFAPVDAALVAAIAALLKGVAAPRILDVGCGAGQTSLSLAGALPGAHVTGIDLSPALVAAAQARAGRSPRCRFVTADASVWVDERGFDLIASRHGVMFFDDPVAALAHIRTRATPDAPLLFSCFRAPALNAWASGLAKLIGGPAPDPDAPGPFAFADEARVRRILSEAGFADIAAAPQDLDLDIAAGGGLERAVAAALSIGPTTRMLEGQSEAVRAAAVADIRKALGAHVRGASVPLGAAIWIVAATNPAR